VLQAQEHYCSFEESCVNAEFDTSSDNDQINNGSKPATAGMHENNLEDENNVDEEEDDSEDEKDDDDEDEEEDDDDDDDDEDDDDDDESYGEYEDGEMYINLWGKPQIVREIEREATLKVLEKSKEYMTKIVFVEEKYEFIRHECRNLHQLCSFWAGQGELRILLLVRLYVSPLTE
jgi:cobalamin biosynthesis protein CobT